MPRVLTFCHECNEAMGGRDGAVCRYCHEVFCDDCGDLGARVCDTCGEEEKEVEEFVQKESRRRAEEVVEEEYGEIGDIDFFGDAA